MSTTERVTVTLPGELVREIDGMEKNRSRFILEAVQHELDRRCRAELRRSLENPHLETVELSEAGFDQWARSLPDEDAVDLVDVTAGKAVRWVQGEGWTEAGE